MKFIPSGMYEITCSDCDAFYIGKTLRTFQQRFNEYKRETKFKEKHVSNSKYSEQIITNFDNYANIEENLKIIYTQRLNRLEEFEIYP